MWHNVKENMFKKSFMCLISLFCLSTAWSLPWLLNNPYPTEQSNIPIYYSSFSEQPKTLDPAQSYSMNEYLFIGQIFEPLLQYDYFKRPYELVPLTTVAMPEVRFLNKNKQLLSEAQEAPAYTVYRMSIKKGILYQPHPAFAMTPDGQYYYHLLSSHYLEEHGISDLHEFTHTGTRELKADDYIYQIKRMANPATGSPLYSMLSQYILGFDSYKKQLPAGHSGIEAYVDLRNYPMEGLQKIDDYTFEIITKGYYRQFIFWLAMNFFAPVPWEADVFYAQPGMLDNNMTFDWYPVGTGPFMMRENNPNRRIILEKNPNYHEDYFPTNGTAQDQKEGFLRHAGERLPLVEQAVYTLEKESIPYWNKFLQGYYDVSDVGQDSFEQAVRINKLGEPQLTEEMIEKKLHLNEVAEPFIYYFGFNMMDPIVGGYTENARKLRQAISIAINIEEDISIFYNGRGIAAQGPLPPGVFGYLEGQQGVNPYVYQWSDGQAKRLSIRYAQQLLKEAGYPKGIDPKTKNALVLHYDMAGTASPQDKALLDWVRKQFVKIGIDLNVRPTLYNRFQDKMRKGNVQIFSWGWSADYPDPENFLYLLYGPNGKVKYGGENAANYHNAEFDRLFNLMKNRENDAERATIIAKMIALVRRDAPWVWGVHPLGLTLSQDWLSPVKRNTLTLGYLKYCAIDVHERNMLRKQWNQPIIWPLGLLALIFFILLLPLIVAYKQKQQMTAPRISKP